MSSLNQGGLVPGFITPDSVYDRRDIYREVFDRHDEASLFDYLWYSDRKMVTKTSKPYHFEDDFLVSDGEVASATGTGAGTPVVVTLAAASHTDGGKRSPFVKKKTVIVYTASARFHCYVTAKDTTTDNAHTITLQPAAGDDLGAVIAAGNIVSQKAYAASDGADEADSEIRLPLVFNNQTQIIKSNVSLDGSASADVVTYNAPNGKPYQYYKAAVDQDLSHRIQIGYSILFERGQSFNDPDTSKAANTLRGLEWWTDTYGYTRTYTTLALTDFEDIQNYWDGQRASTEHMMLAGGKLNMAFDNLYKGQFDQGSIDYAVSGWGNSNPTMKALDYQFNSIHFNNRIIWKKKFDPFTYKPVTGAATSPYPEMALFTPLKKVRNRGQGGPKMYDTIMLRYKAWDKENRYVKHWVRTEEITGSDKWLINSKSDISMLFACGNEYVKLTK